MQKGRWLPSKAGILGQKERSWGKRNQEGKVWGIVKSTFCPSSSLASEKLLLPNIINEVRPDDLTRLFYKLLISEYRFVGPQMIVCMYGCCSAGCNQEPARTLVWCNLFRNEASIIRCRDSREPGGSLGNDALFRTRTHL